MEFVGITQEHSVARLKQLDSAYYKVAGSGSDKEIESGGRANGFVEALVLTTKIAKSQIDQIIEKEHLEFFGMTREKRFQAAGNSDSRWVEKNWQQYDEPAYTRRPLRCKRKT